MQKVKNTYIELVKRCLGAINLHLERQPESTYARQRNFYFLVISRIGIKSVLKLLLALIFYYVLFIINSVTLKVTGL